MREIAIECEIALYQCRVNNLHSAEAATAVPSVTERYQCQAETQSGGGR